MNDETEIESPEIDWNAGQELTGCSDLQVRFVRGLCDGLSKTRAAKAAGYSGEGAGLRGVASRMSKSHKVRALLSWGKAGGAGPSDVEGDPAELRKILWRHARSADAQRSIKASEVLHRLDERERERKQPEDEDPHTVLNRIAEIDTATAVSLARRHGITDWRMPEGFMPDALAAALELAKNLKDQLEAVAGPVEVATAETLVSQLKERAEASQGGSTEAKAIGTSLIAAPAMPAGSRPGDGARREVTRVWNSEQQAWEG